MSESPGQGRPRVVARRRSLRRLRVDLALTRWLVYAIGAAAIFATLRFAIAPPRPAPPRVAPVARYDVAAAGFARIFALRYLTWDSARPDSYAQALAPFIGDGGGSSAGLQLPLTGAQTVAWSDVVQSRDVSALEHVYTVAAQTSLAGLIYLSVDVIHDPVRGLSLGRYPAFVGPTASQPATTLASGTAADVGDAALTAVVARALRNYLAGSLSNLAADLAAGTRVTTPASPLALQRVTQLQWRADRTGVIATAIADDGRGASYTLSYELDVISVDGRWEVAAIQTDPTS